MDEEIIWIQCQCGREWQLDYELSSESCHEDMWKLGVGDNFGVIGEWGPWTDREGNIQ